MGHQQSAFGGDGREELQGGGVELRHVGLRQGSVAVVGGVTGGFKGQLVEGGIYKGKKEQEAYYSCPKSIFSGGRLNLLTGNHELMVVVYHWLSGV